MPGALDWARVIQLALTEGVLPLVYRVAAGRFADRLPAHAMRDIRFHFHEIALRNQVLTRRLLRLIAILENNGVHPVAFKGPALAQLLHGDIAMRQYADLDLLVAPPELPRAIEVLAEDGLTSDSSKASITTHRAFQSSKDVFMDPELGAILDLHWALMPRYFPFTPDSEALCRRAVRLQVENAELATLSLHDQMLVTCAHGARHGWQWLGMVADVAALLRIENGYNWPRLWDEAEAMEAVPILLLGLMLAREALNASVPENIVELARRDPRLVSLTGNLLDSLFAPANVRLAIFRDWIVPLRSIRKRRAQLSYLADRTFTPTFDDWRFLPMSEPLFPLYYLIRPLRLLIQKLRPPFM